MTHPDVSVIVISYNDARRLPAAIASVRRQTLRSLEIIVVDDASTDDTGAIVARLAEQDPRIRYERLPVNSGGCSAPRNRGIELATAPWLMFCDSDDEFERHACKNLLLAAERLDADVVCGATYRQNPVSRTGRRWHPELHEELRVADGLREFPELLFDTISVDKIYRASLIRDHGLRFPEGILYEDQLFTLQAMTLSRRIASIPETVYLWNVAPPAASITRRRSEFRNVDSRVQVNRLIDGFLAGLDEPVVSAVKARKFLEHDLRLYLTSLQEVDDETALGIMHRLRSYVITLDLSIAWAVSPALRVAIYHLLASDLVGVRAAMLYLTQDGAVAERIVESGGRERWGCGHLIDGASFGGRTAEEWLDVTGLHLLRIPVTQRRYAHTLDGCSGTSVNLAGDLDPRIPPTLEVRNGDRVLRTLPARWTSTAGPTWRWSVDQSPRPGPEESLALAVASGGRSNSSVVPSTRRVRRRVTRLRKAVRIGWAELSAVLAMVLGRLVPRRQLIVLESHGGASCTGSVLAVAENLHRRHPGIRQVWSCLPGAGDPPAYARRVTRVSWGHAWSTMRARWCLDDGTMPLDLRVRGAAVTVTAGAPVRRLGLDDPSVLTSPTAQQQALRRSARLRAVLAASRRDAEAARSAWSFAGDVAVVGVPRLDAFFRADARSRAVADADVPADRAVVVYVPESRSPVPFDPVAWAAAMGESTYLLAVGVSVPVDLAWAVRAVPVHADIAALIAASDLVISDYSSSIGDAAALARPIVLFQPDREVYVDRLHGLYPGLDVLGPAITAQPDLHAQVGRVLADLHAATAAQGPAREAFLVDSMGPRDGWSAERAVDALVALP